MSTSIKFICNCKSVTKKEIINAIRKNNAQTLNDVRVITYATSGCGRCKSEVQGIIDTEIAKSKNKGVQYRINFTE